jgi:mRNA-degrading endonuclease RelE of RelBE toxin-antitoxin system
MDICRRPARNVSSSGSDVLPRSHHRGVASAPGEVRGVARRHGVGEWRILFNVEAEKRRVFVRDVVRWTSMTY